MFTVESGDCEAYGDCVHSPNHCPDEGCQYPSDPGDEDNCAIIAHQPARPLEVMHFNTEQGFDFLKVNGVSYSGTTGPDGVLPLPSKYGNGAGALSLIFGRHRST